MIAVEVLVFPVDVQGCDAPAVGACGCGDAQALLSAAVVAQGGAVAGEGEAGVAAWPGIGGTTELIG